MAARSVRLEDELLVLACRDGGEGSFRALVSRWQEPLWRHAYRLTGREDVAWDVVQETWIAVARGITRLEEASGFRSWLFTIATRRAVDRARSDPMTSSIDSSGDLQEPEPDERASDAVELLRRALRRVSGDRRALLSMRYVDGFELEEIARVLEVPVGTVKSRLHNTRNELREIIERLERSE